AGESDSARYLLLSAGVLTISILPWCTFMGATFPLMMAYIRERQSTDPASFSYLYLANVLGAMAGCLATALVLVELLGFRGTLRVAAAGNFLIALICFCVGWLHRKTPANIETQIGSIDSAAGTSRRWNKPSNTVRSATSSSRLLVPGCLFC